MARESVYSNGGLRIAIAFPFISTLLHITVLVMGVIYAHLLTKAPAGTGEDPTKEDVHKTFLKKSLVYAYTLAAPAFSLFYVLLQTLLHSCGRMQPLHVLLSTILLTLIWLVQEGIWAGCEYGWQVKRMPARFCPNHGVDHHWYYSNKQIHITRQRLWVGLSIFGCYFFYIILGILGLIFNKRSKKSAKQTFTNPRY